MTFLRIRIRAPKSVADGAMGWRERNFLPQPLITTTACYSARQGTRAMLACLVQAEIIGLDHMLAKSREDRINGAR
jgi:hypothetical protein